MIEVQRESLSTVVFKNKCNWGNIKISEDRRLVWVSSGKCGGRHGHQQFTRLGFMPEKSVSV